MTRVLPTGWEEKTIGSLCDILDSCRQPITQKDRTKGNYPYYGATGIVDYVDGYLFDEPLLLVGEDGAQWGSGATCSFVATGKYWVNNHAHVLKPHAEILMNYLMHWLNFSNLNKYITGTTVQKLNQQKLRSIPVAYPSLPEQKQIVEKLDKIFANIDKAKEQTTQNLKNAQEVFESSLDAVLTKEAAKWPEKKLNDVCVVERGSSPRPIKSFITTAPDGVNWIKIGDCSGKYVTSTSQKITPEGAKKSRYVRRGDFIISNSMSYGKPYIMDIDGYIHDGWFVLRLNHSILVADFLYYILSSPFAKRQYDILAAGAIVQNISSDLIKKVKFNLPSISEQKRIVAQLDNLHNKTQELEKVYTQKLVDLDELKQSVLQQAFSGKL